MTEQIQSELISRRRAFSLIGVAVPIVMLAAREATAQTPGMERREERREGVVGAPVVVPPATTGSSGAPK